MFTCPGHQFALSLAYVLDSASCAFQGIDQIGALTRDIDFRLVGATSDLRGDSTLFVKSGAVSAVFRIADVVCPCLGYYV